MVRIIHVKASPEEGCALDDSLNIKDVKGVLILLIKEDRHPSVGGLFPGEVCRGEPGVRPDGRRPEEHPRQHGQGSQDRRAHGKKVRLQGQEVRDRFPLVQVGRAPEVRHQG